MALALDCPVVGSGSLLLLEPLARDVGVSSESPVVVIVVNEDVYVPADEQKDQVDEASVELVSRFDPHQL